MFPKSKKLLLQKLSLQALLKTKGNTPENIYIQRATLDGEPLNKFWFYHDDFADGGSLTIELGSEPSGWGVTKNR